MINKIIEDDNGEDKTVKADFQDTCEPDVTSERTYYGSKKEKCVLVGSF